MGVNDGTPTSTDARTTCLTSAYTTITGCSVLNSVATVTTTRTSEPRPSDPLCGPACGNGACQAFRPGPGATADAARPQRPPQRQSRSAGPKLVGRGEPRDGEWIDPSDYAGGYQEFMQEEFEFMRTRRNFGVSHHQPKLVLDGPPMPDERDSLTTVRSNWILFQDKVETLAVEGLVGCTVVVVVSDRGAWMGKFYEETVADAALFAEALSKWKTGRQPQDAWSLYARYGVDDLRNHPERGEVGKIFGSADDPIGFPVGIYTISPRRRVAEQGEESSQGPPPSQFDSHLGGTPVYPQVGRIDEDFRGVASTHTYRADSAAAYYLQEQLTEAERYHREHGELSDMYWSRLLQDRILDTAKGKVMLQYKPANRCSDSDLASWRLWIDEFPHFEESIRPQYEDTWLAHDDQYFSDTLRPQYAGELYSRQECPVRGKPASGGDGSVSSASPPSATSAGQRIPGAPATPSGGGGGGGGQTQSPPPGSSYLNGTAAPLPWNSSVTTHAGGMSGGVTTPLPTSFSSPNGTEASVSRNGTTMTAPGYSPSSHNSHSQLPPTASRSWNGTMLPTAGGNATATLGSSGSSSNATATPAWGASSSRSSSVSIFTTVYVAGPPVTLPPPPPPSPTSSKPTTSPSAPPLKRVTVTASVRQSVVKTVTVITATVIVPAKPTSSALAVPVPMMRLFPAVPFLKLKRSQAVYVMHEEVMAAGPETIANGEMFVMFPVTVDVPISHCEAQRLGWKPSAFWEDRSWPPSLEARKGREAFGRKKCAYKAKQEGFGSFKCEGVAEFNCFKDPDYAKKIDCKAGLDNRTYRPRMRCVFPDQG
ncbi:hypothetical protein CTA1_11165 [Colletotrichum tanaceti]|uniref:Uncharacterized protein n=1 Tax=Colletotrichum tanaceti TaxID=1306861 RepID=A0A4U6X307_9PEZI|nr:hypothetical protein CTA1_11165 [Colletotrichum tanaceti]